MWFAGLFSKDLNKNSLLEITNNMSKHCFIGADDCGNWIDENLGLSISHQRLSILVIKFWKAANDKS